MNSFVRACVTLSGAGALAVASPEDRFVLATMALSERPNYSWYCAADDDARIAGTEGKIDATGLTWIRMPMVTSIGRRLGRETDTQLEVYFVGEKLAALRSGERWSSPTELPEAGSPAAIDRTRTTVRGSASVNAQARSAAAAYDERASADHRSFPFGLTPPHEELAIIASSYTGLDTAGDVVRGSLSDIGARLLLVSAGQHEVTPIAASGTFALWIRDRAVVKYQLRIDGVMETPGRRQITVRRASTTHLKDIGTTQIAVPDGARPLLGL